MVIGVMPRRERTLPRRRVPRQPLLLRLPDNAYNNGRGKQEELASISAGTTDSPPAMTSLWLP